MPLAEDFGDCLCFNLRRATRRVTQAYDRALAGTGLTATQFSLLAMLNGAREEPTISTLAEWLGTERTTLTRNLALVEGNGLVTVRPGPDPRSKRVTLTAHGRRVLQRAAPLWRRAQADAGRRLGADQMAFLEMTRRIAAP